jgi:hypothetical protein
MDRSNCIFYSLDFFCGKSCTIENGNAPKKDDVLSLRGYTKVPVRKLPTTTRLRSSMNLSQYRLVPLLATTLVLSTGCGEEPEETTTSATLPTTTTTTTGNQVPYSISAYILPASPDVGDTLNCIVDSPLIDPDGDPVTVITNWTVNGAVISQSKASVSAPNFSKDDVVACVVTPNDGIDDGPSTTTEPVIIINSEPRIEDVTLSPDPASVADAIYCDWTFTDADSDEDQSTVSWTINGTEGSTEIALVTDFVEGDLISCTVTPFDGDDLGAEKSASLVVGNAAPSIVTVNITPEPATATDTLSCSYEGFTDHDSLDSDYSTYLWSVNGVDIGNDQTISGAFVSGDNVTCTVTPYDGTDSGTPLTDSLTITNTAPILESVTLGPEPATELEVLTCSPGIVTDPDTSKKITYTYTWAVNGGVIAGTDSTLTGDDFNRADVVTCTATAFDGEDTSLPVTSNSVTIENLAPSVGAVSITPEPALTTDTLLCAWSDFQDTDGDDDYSFSTWAVNGVEVSVSTSLASGFIGGDEVSCAVTPNDGNEDGIATIYSIVVQNSLPTIDSVEISPDTPVVTDDLTCSYTNFQDADANLDSSTYQWAVNGDDAGTSSTLLAGSFTGGDSVSCTVTPHDGIDAGLALAATITIDNTPPVLASLTLTPEEPTIADTLSCDLGATTDDDGTVKFTHQYVWNVNGTEIAATGTTLTSVDFSKNDAVYCAATPNDGIADGEAVMSNTVTAINTLPTVDSVEVTPAVATATDTLTCSWAGFSDADGDADASTLAWTVNGVLVGIDADLTGSFVGADEVTCTVTPTDDQGAGDAVMQSITIENSAPVLDSVAISPDPAYADSTLNCNLGSTTDIDGAGSFTFIYSWEVNGILNTSTGPTLEADQFITDDTINCSATPNDGTDYGMTMTSSDVTVVNSAPVIGTVSITPDPAYIADDLTCNVTDVNDADGTTAFIFSYAWTVNGVVNAEVSPTFAATDTLRFDDVTCSVTANDGAVNSAAVTSAIHTIQNSLPNISTVTVTPDTAYAGDTLTCTYDGFTDADNDDDNSTIAWSISGLTIGSAPTLSTGFGNGDEVICTVTANDGIDAGGTASDSATIGNTAPTLNSVSLSPNDPTTNSNVFANVDAVDVDSDTLTFTYTWRINGVVNANTSNVISGTTAFSKGDTIAVEVSANDGVETTASMTSSTITVVNSAPTISSTSINPAIPTAGIDDLICQASGTSDADGDAYTISYTWRVNESNYLGPVQQSVDPGDTISGTNTSPDDVWQCITSATDGSDTSAGVLGSVNIPSTPSCGSLEYSSSSATWTTVSGFDELDGGSRATIEAWVYLDDFTDNGVIFSSDFMSCHIAGAPTFGPDQNKWRCTADDVEIFSTDVATIDDWTHIALQFNNGQVSLYVNGISEGIAPATSTLVGSLGTVRFGYIFGSSLNAAFDGLIDEIRVSDTVRYTTNTTPQANFTPDSSTNALWHFDEGTGTVTADATGNGWDATISGATWVTQSTCDL